MKRFTGLDARHKIKGNVQDARQLLKNRQTQGKFANTQDARFKIRAKKFQPIKQELLKIKSTEKSLSKPFLPGRTITNKQAGATTFSRLQKSKMNTTAPGLVSVSGGKRKLIDKVTVHQTGLKIAVHNEFATSAPRSKKDESLKITLNNPAALRKQTIPVFQNYKSQLTNEKLMLDRQKRQTYSFDSMSKKASHLSMFNKGGFKYPHNASFPPHGPTLQLPSSSMGQPTTIRSSRAQGSSTHGLSRKMQKEPSLASKYSPLEGTKILVSNLHPVVVEDDILELFSVIGPLRRARMTGHGKAEVVYVRKNDAILAYQKYNNRDLDGQPMMMELLLHDETQHNKTNYTWMTAIGKKKQAGTVEIEPSLLQRSLFQTSTSGVASRPVVFTVKI